MHAFVSTLVLVPLEFSALLMLVFVHFMFSLPSDAVSSQWYCIYWVGHLPIYLTHGCQYDLWRQPDLLISIFGSSSNWLRVLSLMGLVVVKIDNYVLVLLKPVRCVGSVRYNCSWYILLLQTQGSKWQCLWPQAKGALVEHRSWPVRIVNGRTCGSDKHQLTGAGQGGVAQRKAYLLEQFLATKLGQPQTPGEPPEQRIQHRSDGYQGRQGDAADVASLTSDATKPAWSRATSGRTATRAIVGLDRAFGSPQTR